MNVEELNALIKHQLQFVEGYIALYAKDLNNDFCCKINENEIFNTASLMKLVVGLECMRLVETGTLNINKPHILKNSFRSKFDNSIYELSPEIDSDPDLYTKIGFEINIYELIERMITRSSNLATNNLFELIAKENSFDNILKEIGVYSTHIVRGVEDQKAYDAGIINTTTAVDMIKILEHIYNGVLQKNTYLTQLYNFLLKQEHNSIIPARLPENLLIAHKTGNLTKSLHDAAIITSSNGIRYLLVILSKNLENKENAIAVFSKISELIYDFLKKK